MKKWGIPTWVWIVLALVLALGLALGLGLPKGSSSDDVILTAMATATPSSSHPVTTTHPLPTTTPPLPTTNPPLPTTNPPPPPPDTNTGTSTTKVVDVSTSLSSLLKSPADYYTDGPYVGYDFPGGEIFSINKSTLNECAFFCDKTPDCLFFQMDNTDINNNVCHLKKNYSNMQINPTQIAYGKPGTLSTKIKGSPSSITKISPTNYSPPVSGYNFITNNVGSPMSGKDINACAAACDKNPTCNFFETIDNLCYMRSSFDNLNAIRFDASSNVYSPSGKTGPLDSFYLYTGPFSNVHYSGGNGAEYSTADPIACAAACTNDTNCNFFEISSDSRKCWMYNDTIKSSLQTDKNKTVYVSPKAPLSMLNNIRKQTREASASLSTY
jgi:hypothetical protein